MQGAGPGSQIASFPDPDRRAARPGAAPGRGGPYRREAPILGSVKLGIGDAIGVDLVSDPE